ncbi:hypothetical protein Y032_0194g1431 [Ancylostoma ceylanicum]|uniref:Uncharacterized protein n=1 Tax=Ancylostoma ceylanicum TaxID=53326 RepID=A0A016SQ13_9BILA|nr:hypothetical protein Y032_0194g1431 [Ancylostoma ceylanicum]
MKKLGIRRVSSILPVLLARWIIDSLVRLLQFNYGAESMDSSKKKKIKRPLLGGCSGYTEEVKELASLSVSQQGSARRRLQESLTEAN